MLYGNIPVVGEGDPSNEFAGDVAENRRRRIVLCDTGPSPYGEVWNRNAERTVPECYLGPSKQSTLVLVSSGTAFPESIPSEFASEVCLRPTLGVYQISSQPNSLGTNGVSDEERGMHSTILKHQIIRNGLEAPELAISSVPKN